MPRIYSFLLVVASVVAFAARVMAEADGPDFYDVKGVMSNFARTGDKPLPLTVHKLNGCAARHV